MGFEIAMCALEESCVYHNARVSLMFTSSEMAGSFIPTVGAPCRSVVLIYVYSTANGPRLRYASSSL
jgi:hypothetical protein